MRQIAFHEVSGLFAVFGVDIQSTLRAARSPAEATALFEKAVGDCKGAYKKLAMQLHPDRNGGKDDEFKEVTNAWNVLKAIKPNFQPPPPVVRIVIRTGMSYTSSSTTGSWY